MSLIEVNRAFQSLKNEIVNIHTSLPAQTGTYTPEEEAVIVLTKIATVGELLRINLYRLPKEFLIKALVRGSEYIAGTLTDPSGLISSELLKMSRTQIINYLTREEVKMSVGKIPASYTDINNERQKEELLYSIIKDKEDNLVVAIYSQKHIPAPLSVPGSVIRSSLWRQKEFDKEEIKPFVITFSGKVEKTSQGLFFWKDSPQVEIDFPDDPLSFNIPSSPSLAERLKNIGGGIWKSTSSFLGNVGEFLGDSLQAMIGGGQKETFVSLDEIDLDNVFLQEERPKEKIEETKEEEDKRVEKETRDKKEIVIETQEKASPVVKRIEINSALGENLEKLSGIGPVYAERIITSRPFCNIEDLTDIDGIGNVTLSNIKKQGIAYVDSPSGCFEEKAVAEAEEDFNREELVTEVLEIKERIAILRGKIDDKTDYDDNGDANGYESDDNGNGDNDDNDEEKKPSKIKEVEINSASKEELKIISGIGSFLAERIIDTRPFCNLDELIRVSGIGEATVTRIKNENIAYVKAPTSCINDNGDDDYSDIDDDNGTDSDDSDDDNGDDDNGDKEKEAPKIEAVEINSASKEKLELITGVGPVTAEKIVDARPFCSLGELLEIGGIGEATFNNILKQGTAYVKVPDSCFTDNGNEASTIIIFHSEAEQSKPLNKKVPDATGCALEIIDKLISYYEEIRENKILEQPAFIN